MHESEFPQTRWSKIGDKIGWLFSPFLLMFLIAFTLFSAEKLNFTSEGIEKRGSIEIKTVKGGKVFLNSKEVGSTPGVFDVSGTDLVNLKITKEGKREWNKIVSPKQGFVKIFYPLLYPEVVDFQDEKLNVSNFYGAENANFFFYERKIGNKTVLFRYSVYKQLLGVQERNELFADITDLIKPEGTGFELKKYFIYPGKTGKKLLLVVPNEAMYVVEGDSKFEKIPNIIPQIEDTYAWSPNDSYLVYNNTKALYSLDIESDKQYLLYERKTLTEKIEVQFLLESSLIYKTDDEFTELIQDAYIGAQTRKIEIPNTRLDNLRKNNILKVYDFLEKQNLILIQSQENFYSYDVGKFELKKINKFKGERIVYVDALTQMVLSVNTENETQMRLYSFDQLYENKTFSINTENISKLVDVKGFNNGNSLVLVYDNKIELIDSDGANQIILPGLLNPQLLMAQRIDNDVVIAIAESINIEQTNTSDPLAPITTESKYQIRYEKFEN